MWPLCLNAFMFLIFFFWAGLKMKEMKISEITSKVFRVSIKQAKGRGVGLEGCDRRMAKRAHLT